VGGAHHQFSAAVHDDLAEAIGLHGVDVWWPQLDDGLYLPDFLEYRWGKEKRGVAA